MESTAAQRNIKAICEMEQNALAQRPLSARVSDAVASHAGKMWFAVAHAVWFAVWILANLLLPKPDLFDPFPFSLLTMIVSLESIFLSLFILMSQNRSGLQADRRNQLDLQINLLAEDENTKMIQMLQALCRHHRLAIGDDKEIHELAERTEVSEVLADLRTNLPTEDDADYDQDDRGGQDS